MIVLVCEGNCEVKLMSWLLENQQLGFTDQEILDHRPLHIRQPKTILPVLNALPPNEDIIFYRIGDTLNDVFDIACFGKIRQEHIRIINVCTTPEIEILIIICEGLYDDFLKVKSDISPKEFVKMNIKGYDSFEDYIRSHDIVQAIKEYKRIKVQRRKNDIFLADLLK